MQELWERVIAMRTPKLRKIKLELVNPPAFLFRMLKNLAVDEFRKRKNEISLDEHSSHETHESYRIFEQETTAIGAIILDALEKLPPDDREVLVLNIYSGYSFGEIAELLGASTDAIWQRASRARVKLRKIVLADAERMGITLPVNHNGKEVSKRND